MESKFAILDGFDSIELSQMDSIRLMNRIDTKYLTNVRTLEEILVRAAGYGYLVFEISGDRIQEYRSMYYDTPSLQMYLDHHNRRLVRQKLRTRCYSSGETFLEIKSKNNHGRTKKKRIEIASGLYKMDAIDDNSVVQWLDGKMMHHGNGDFPFKDISPSLETVFSRLTLVNPQMTERSTIDFDIRFNNPRNNRMADMGDLAVIEVKQDGNLPSKLRDILLEYRVKPIRISKYCIGTAITDETVRSGRFKKKLMLINKLKKQI